MDTVVNNKIDDQRFRVLIENAPEAIVIFDADTFRFVDSNQKAVDLLKIPQDKFLNIGPFDFSPESQNGFPTFEIGPKYIQETLEGANPVFDWLHIDGEGNEIPCEVRLVYLPSENQNLIRASIIDKRKTRQLKHDLSEKEERLRIILEASGLACFDYDIETLELYWDDNVFKIFGLDKKEGEPQLSTFIEILHDEDKERIARRLIDFTNNVEVEESFEDEFRIIKNEKVYHIYTKGSVIKGSEGVANRVLGTLKNITQEKLAQTNLLYQTKLLENTSDAVISIDNDMIIKSWNRAASDLYGWQEKDVIGHSIKEIMKTDYLGFSREEVIQYYLDHGHWTGTVKQSDRAGNKIYCFSTLSVLKDAEGSSIGTLAINKNITEERKVVEKLQESEERSRLASESTGLAYFDWEFNSNKIYMDKWINEILDIEYVDTMQFLNDFVSKLHPDNVEQITNGLFDIDRVDDGENHFGAQFKMIINDELKYLYSYGLFTRDENGTIQRIIGSLQDITIQTEAKEKLQFQSQLIDNIFDAAISTDKDFNIKTWNEGAELLYGWKSEEVIGKSVYEILPTTYLEDNREEVLSDFEEKGEWSGIVLQEDKEGNKHHILSSVSAIIDSNGARNGAIAIKRILLKRLNRTNRLSIKLIYWRKFPMP